MTKLPMRHVKNRTSGVLVSKRDGFDIQNESTKKYMPHGLLD
jgi:hypothetical protein